MQPTKEAIERVAIRHTKSLDKSSEKIRRYTVRLFYAMLTGDIEIEKLYSHLLQRESVLIMHKLNASTRFLQCYSHPNRSKEIAAQYMLSNSKCKSN